MLANCPAGYHFTETEFEDYTAQLLSTEQEIDQLESLGEKELAAILGSSTVRGCNQHFCNTTMI
jgi:hypothetical protein